MESLPNGTISLLNFHLYVYFVVADGTEYSQDIPPFLSESSNATLRFVSNFLFGQGVLMSYILSKLFNPNHVFAVIKISRENAKSNQVSEKCEF